MNEQTGETPTHRNAREAEPLQLRLTDNTMRDPRWRVRIRDLADGHERVAENALEPKFVTIRGPGGSTSAPRPRIVLSVKMS